MQGRSAWKISLMLALLVGAVAAGLAMLIEHHAPQYESLARLTFSPRPGAALTAGSGLALAKKTLDEKQLLSLAGRYNLYPQIRERETGERLLDQLQRDLVLSETSPALFEVRFRSASQQQAISVANAVAATLADARQTISVAEPDPVKPMPAKKGIRRGATAASKAEAQPLTGVAQPPMSMDAGALSRQIQRIEDTLQDLESARVELVTEQQSLQTRIRAAEELEAKEQQQGNAEEAAAKASNAQRDALLQQLNAEQFKLAQLRSRYTEAYPDVQRSIAAVASLQTRIEKMPPPSASHSAHGGGQTAQAQLASLGTEQTRVEQDLARTDASKAAQQAHKAQLQARLAAVRSGAKVPAVAAVTATSQTSPVAPQAGKQAAPVHYVTQSFAPFSITAAADRAKLAGLQQHTLWMGLAIGTGVLLLLCLVPLFTYHPPAPVSSSDDLQEVLPAHVLFLGYVRRAEP